MTQRRSARRKVLSVEETSKLKKPDSFPTQVTSTRTPKVQPVLKNQTETFLPSAAAPAIRLSTTKGKKRKLGDLQDERLSKAPAPDLQDQRSGQRISKTKLGGRNKAKDDDRTREQDQEKRLRRYRGKPPQSFLAKLHRAQTQRYILKMNQFPSL